MNPTESAQVVAGGDFEDAGIRPNSKGTLEFALRPYRISQEKLREMHGAVLGMITKILGERSGREGGRLRVSGKESGRGREEVRGWEWSAWGRLGFW